MAAKTLCPLSTSNLATANPISEDFIERGQILIYNFKGELVFNDAFYNSKGKLPELNLSHLPEGIYMLRLHTDIGMFSNKKFVITKN